MSNAADEILLQSAAQDQKDLQAEREIKQGRVRALLGDGNGNLDGPSGVPWVFARLGGDPSRLVQAYNGTPLTPTNDMSVSLFIRYTEGRVSHYEIERLSNDVPYPGYIPGLTGAVAKHAIAHEFRVDGGWDAVNIYERAFTSMRVNAQVLADLTLQVAAGYYAIDGQLYSYDGGNTVAFSPPGSGVRYDVLTIDTAGALNIEVGALTLPPIAFSIPAHRLPLIAVRTYIGQTSITEDDLFDIRPFLSISNSGAVTSGAFALTGIISPPSFGTNQDNYNPTGIATAAVMRLTASAAYNITGLASGTDGKLMFIHNVGSYTITFVNESGSSSPANRFALVANVALKPNGLLLLQYDATSTRWRAISGTGGGSQWSVLTNGDAVNPALVFAGGDVIMVETI